MPEMWSYLSYCICSTEGREMFAIPVERHWYFVMMTNQKQFPKRLNVYHEQTQPLIDYYTKQGILKTVDGTQSRTGSSCSRQSV